MRYTLRIITGFTVCLVSTIPLYGQQTAPPTPQIPSPVPVIEAPIVPVQAQPMPAPQKLPALPPTTGNEIFPQQSPVAAPPNVMPSITTPSVGIPANDPLLGSMPPMPSDKPPAPPPVSYGPTPLYDVGLLQDILMGERKKDSKIKFGGWMESDYNYRSTGGGRTAIAPMMNRYGNEFMMRELGLYVMRPLDPKDWSWGYNIVYFGGSDAAVINPSVGWYSNPNPRFSQMFTDLNLTAHLPILTEGGVDVKAGRQTSVLGPMGALGWQRPFATADYGWYNLEEGRYTGVSANWHITKQLSWYNGIEFGWGTFFNQIGNDVDYLTQLVYWVDPAMKKTKLWFTVLTGPTSLNSNAFTTIIEFGFSHNVTERLYTGVNYQSVYSNGPVNAPVPDGYLQRAYTVYTYSGYHLTPTLDINVRYDWYKDVDGRGYAGGYGVPHTNYFEMTYGFDYHPYAWLQIRPEIRYDHASNPSFGADRNKTNQLGLTLGVLTKF